MITARKRKIMSKNKIKRTVCLVAMAILLLLLLGCEIFKDRLFGAFADLDAAYLTASRFIGGMLSLVLIIYISFQNILKLRLRTLGSALLFSIPCWVIAFNNFPIISFFSGNAYINEGAAAVLFYAFECLCVGFFEEIVFRGCVLMIVMQRRRHTRLELFVSILISSLIFGVVHLVNIFAGASPGAVILQVGYSSLIGAMCAVVLMKTGCIWHCVLIHAVYNFCGGVVPRCGGGVIWDTPTVILTTVVSLLVIAYMIAAFMRIDTDKLGYLYGDEKMREEDKADVEIQ